MTLSRPAARKDDAAAPSAEATPPDDRMDRLLALMETHGSTLDSLASRLDAVEAKKGKDDPDDKDGDPDDKLRARSASERADGAPREKPWREMTQMERRTMDAELAMAQSRADEAFAGHGKRAPMPIVGETPIAYRVRMAGEHKHFSPTHAGVNLGAVARADQAAFGLIEGKIYADSAAEAARPTMFGDHETIRQVRRYDKNMGRDVLEYFGPQSYVKRLSPACPRVVRFNTTFAP